MPYAAPRRNANRARFDRATTTSPDRPCWIRPYQRRDMGAARWRETRRSARPASRFGCRRRDDDRCRPACRSRKRRDSRSPIFREPSAIRGHRHHGPHPVRHRAEGPLLQRTLLAYLGHAIEAMSCDPQTIYEIVIAGNTTMRDLLFGLDVYSVGQRPYRSITEIEMAAGKRRQRRFATTAKKLRLPVFPAARVYGCR